MQETVAMPSSHRTAVAAVAAIVAVVLLPPVFPMRAADAPSVEKEPKPAALRFVRTTRQDAKLKEPAGSVRSGSSHAGGAIPCPASAVRAPKAHTKVGLAVCICRVCG